MFLKILKNFVLISVYFLGYDMSPFVRRYAKYLTEKSVSYRNTAFDFCKVKRGWVMWIVFNTSLWKFHIMLGLYYWEIFSYHHFRKDGGTLRQMNAEKLLKTLPQLQNQLDALVDFEVKIHFNKIQIITLITKFCVEFIN